MANNITINLAPSGLGAPLAGEDFISGLIFYSNNTLPSGFSTSSRIHEVFSITDAEALGITNNSSGETRATGTFTITTTGTTGNIINVSVETSAGLVSLASYTVTSTDSNSTVASQLATTINDGLLGYTATASTASTVTVTAPQGTGLGANYYTFATSSFYSATTFSGGIACPYIDTLHYHVSEYFRANPKGDLYIYIQSATTDFSEIVTLQDYSGGLIRQVGIFSPNTFSTSNVALIQTQLNTCDANSKPLEAVYQADFSTVTDLTTLTNLHTLNAQNVSVTIGQDGNAQGEALWLATQKTVGCVGLTLGAISKSKVSESIGWVGQFNMSDVEMETLAFANGALYNSLSDGLKNNIDAKGYIFLKKYVGISGSYFDNPYTCVAVTSDYSRINHNRTINKAKRGIRTYLLPSIASPIKVNADGTLTRDVISYFQTQTGRALEQMQRDGELSAFQVTINPTQNVLSTGQLIIGVAIVPIGTSDEIIVNIGFTLSIQTT